MTRGALFIVVVALLDCGGDQATAKNVTLDPAPSASSSSSVVRPSRFPIASIKVANAKEHSVYELKDDGTIFFDDKPKGKIVGQRIERMDGTLAMSIGSDGSLTSPDLLGNMFVVKLNDKDELVMPDGAKMFITDAGLVTLYETNGALATESGNSTVLAFRPSTRRVTSTIVFAMFMLEIHAAGK